MASSYFRPIILLTAILTLAQALAWFVMSLLGILAYRCELDTPVINTSGAQFTVLLYYLYFQGPACPAIVGAILPPGVILRDSVYATPSLINAWMASYLVFNITYFILAICLFVGLCRSVNGSASQTVLRLWCANTFAFLIMDLWLTIIWGVDFQNITDFIDLYANDLKGTFDWATSVPGALMAITARGFILYIINFALFVYIVRYTCNWGVLFGSCCQQQNNGSQEQLHDKYPSDNLSRAVVPYNQHTIPRLSPEWDNGQILPVGRTTYPHSNAVEGITSFNGEWVPAPYRQTRQQSYAAEPHVEPRSRGRGQPPSIPARHRPDELQQGPSIGKSTRDNFEQGGNNRPSGRGYPPTNQY